METGLCFPVEGILFVCLILSVFVCGLFVCLFVWRVCRLCMCSMGRVYVKNEVGVGVGVYLIVFVYVCVRV